MTTTLSEQKCSTAKEGQGVVIWLVLVAALVFAMIVVGGATRLTDSGLSITEWKPILGAIPPLSAADWQDAFAKYQQIPEYHQVNKGMSLDEFKFIFWWEWSHRFLGRIIGVAFGVPLLVFWLRGKVHGTFARNLLGILALGALQGAIGWYMVSSGLVDRVDVSQYRLALHLGVAFLIFSLLIYILLDLVRGQGPRARGISPAQRTFAGWLVVAVFVQVLLGALVAGLKAGLAYNTWPDMNGAWIPDGLGAMSPYWINHFENVTTVQFNHRMMAYLVAGLVLLHVMTLWPAASGRVRKSAAILAAAVCAQIVIGIATLLHAVPLSLGLIHQGGAAVVLGLAVGHWHLLRGVANVAAEQR